MSIGSIPRNLSTYELLFRIENVLRELIIEVLSDISGPKWEKQRLPGDVWATCLEGVEFERSLPWLRFVPLHPLYYAYLTDLRKVIERRDNWQDGFKAIFGNRDWLATALAELEPIRNRVAHNRVVTDSDVRLVEGANERITQAVGEVRVGKLLARITSASGIVQVLGQLQEEAKRARSHWENLTQMTGLPVWERVSDSWWFDSAYLGIDLAAIETLFGRFEEYSALPRSRGMGYRIERFTKGNRIEDLFRQAEETFGSLLELDLSEIA